MKNKKVPKKIKEDRQSNKKALTENQMMVLLEDMSDDIKVIAEEQGVLNDKTDRFRNELKNEILEFKRDTESNFKTIFRHLSDIDNELKSIKSEIAELKMMLTQKADLKRLLDLEHRVTILERDLAVKRL